MFHSAHFLQDFHYVLCSIWICIPELPLISCVTWHKLINLSVPQSPLLISKDNDSIYWIGLLWESNEFTCRKIVEHCLACSKASINVNQYHHYYCLPLLETWEVKSKIHFLNGFTLCWLLPFHWDMKSFSYRLSSGMCCRNRRVTA